MISQRAQTQIENLELLAREIETSTNQELTRHMVAIALRSIKDRLESELIYHA